MHVIMRLLLGLVACVWLQSAWCAAVIADTDEECISEPIFEGRVCTIQANRGAKTGVILIHGLGGSVNDWLRTLPALAADFHVVAFDLPGFGLSDKGSQRYSPTRYAHLAQFLAEHYFHDKPYHIVGHSMGGAIALRFAAQHPLRFQRLVLIDAAGILYPQVIIKFQAGSMMERASGVWQTRGFAERLSGKLLDQAERLSISPNDIVSNALGRDFVLRGGPEKIAALGLAGEDFSDAIPAVTEPTLILWGDHDLVAPLRTGKILAARMSHARLEIINDSGHEPMLDQPERLNILIKKHLLASDQDLAESYQQVSPLPPFASERTGSCSGESGQIFEGDYKAIKLRDCSNITIRNARIGQLSAINSRLNIIDSEILGKNEGLHADNSDITITNGAISGVIAIKAIGSRFDIAGVQLKGTQAAVKGLNSKFVFSICRINSPHMNGALHTFKSMIDEEL